MLSRRQSLAALGADFACVGNAPRGGGGQVRVLTLNDGENLDSTLFRLCKGWRLQFRPGPSLFGKTVSLFCNLPATADDTFDRARYRALPWKHDASARGSDDSAAFADVEIHRAGSFHFYFTFAGSSEPGFRGSGYFTVEPVLGFGPAAGEVLPLDCVQCQTVLVKSLGPLDSWLAKLRVTRESGYNMVHFTPIQELGGSNSSYSLRDQLALNPTLGAGVTVADVDTVVNTLRTEWKMLSVCDIVLNHTANETPWLSEHPEATYNCANCPHLRPAYLLDAALARFSRQVARGDWTHRGVPPAVNSEDHLNAIRSALWESVVPATALPALFLVDSETAVSDFLSLARSRLPHADPAPAGAEVRLRQDPSYRRDKTDVDLELALHIYNVYRTDCFDEETRLRRCADDFRARLNELNACRAREIEAHLAAAIENTVAGIRYFRVDPAGPRIETVTEKEPLVPRYFTSPLPPTASLEDEEGVAFCADRGRFLMAHNGWVMDSDPLTNFAAADSQVYLRRELIAWGDSVKLRYGDRPEDSAFLWQHMTAYVEQTARTFDGIRLDNCHSTPIPVAEYLLDAARRVRPDLYVVAELFTNSDSKDNIFVNRLGITSLIREALSAWDGHELGRLVFRYGGEPVGAFRPPPLRPLRPSVAHALFLDATHDNPSAVETRSARYSLPAAALVAMAACATGSSRGHDEMVPHHIHVVDETRPYAAWRDGVGSGVDATTGIIAAKRALNTLHSLLGNAGFTQMFVDQMDADVVAVTRHSPRDHDTVVLVAHTAFRRDQALRDVKPLRVQGVVSQVLLEASLEERTGASAEFARSDDVINGLANFTSVVRENVPLSESRFLEAVDSGEAGVTQLRIKDFPPGAVVAIRVSLDAETLSALSALSAAAADAGTLSALSGDLSLADLNRALFRCAEEERDDGGGVYDIPGCGAPVYCGLQGFMSLLSDIRPLNDLGHPLCANLRAGDWMLDYVTGRLQREAGTRALGDWLASALAPVKRLPRFLVPSYFDLVVTATYAQLLEAAWDKMSEFVSDGSSFTRWLALGSVQCTGVVRSAPLPAVPARDRQSPAASLAAGLPHFAAGYMRTWGRDTFISLRGLFLLTGRFQDARNHILGFGACLRHGLIPNLLDGGNNARFNCRDAVWWWLHSVAAYVELAPEGASILNDTVLRIFPNDTAAPAGDAAKEQPLHEVIQEAMSVHFQGLSFRERNAGRAIDAHMTDQGFSNQIGIHPETGFVFGGNAANCGTWMDKMGSSERAGTRGKPASPRDGSAVELVGLSAAAARFLATMHEEGKFPHAGVTRTNRDGSKTTWTYREWHRKIAANFEARFFVPETATPGEDRPELVHRRGIYKDTLNSQLPWTDFQLRPNFPIAIVVAPELFTPARAWTALEAAGKLLCGPLGMKTLDPGDWAYRGDYHNDDDSEDPAVAHGFNYHQGPEWVWPIGFFLRARLRTALAHGGPALASRVAKETRAALAPHLVAVSTDAWRGLPELTNADGKLCPGSCRTQAWSNATVLEVLYELSALEGRAPITLDAVE